MRISDWSSDVCSSDLDSRDNLFSGITARAMIQQPAKSALVRWVFIDVRDAQFWLPKKRMIRTFEYLPLLGDRMNDRFQRRSAISDADPTGLDFGDHLGETTPNRTQILTALVPKKPALIARVRVSLPSLNQLPRPQSK